MLEKEEKKSKKKTWGAFSGSKIPDCVLEGRTIFSTKMRLKDGIKRFAISEYNHTQTESSIRVLESSTLLFGLAKESRV